MWIGQQANSFGVINLPGGNLTVYLYPVPFAKVIKNKMALSLVQEDKGVGVLQVTDVSAHKASGI